MFLKILGVDKYAKAERRAVGVVGWWRFLRVFLKAIFAAVKLLLLYRSFFRLSFEMMGYFLVCHVVLK